MTNHEINVQAESIQDFSDLSMLSSVVFIEIFLNEIESGSEIEMLKKYIFYQAIFLIAYALINKIHSSGIYSKNNRLNCFLLLRAN